MLNYLSVFRLCRYLDGGSSTLTYTGRETRKGEHGERSVEGVLPTGDRTEDYVIYSKQIKT